MDRRVTPSLQPLGQPRRCSVSGVPGSPGTTRWLYYLSPNAPEAGRSAPVASRGHSGRDGLERVVRRPREGVLPPGDHPRRGHDQPVRRDHEACGPVRAPRGRLARAGRRDDRGAPTRGPQGVVDRVLRWPAPRGDHRPRPGARRRPSRRRDPRPARLGHARGRGRAKVAQGQAQGADPGAPARPPRRGGWPARRAGVDRPDQRARGEGIGGRPTCRSSPCTRRATPTRAS